MKIGYIGLGSLGRHLAGSLLSAGFPLTVHDIHKGAAADLGKAAPRGPTPADTARASDTVITCLPSPETVAATVEGEHGILAASPPAAPGST